MGYGRRTNGRRDGQLLRLHPMHVGDGRREALLCRRTPVQHGDRKLRLARQRPSRRLQGLKSGRKRKKAEESGRKRLFRAEKKRLSARKEATFSRGKKANFCAKASDFPRGSKRLSGRKRRKIMNLVYDDDRWANFSRIICIFVLFPVCIPLF